MGSAYSLEGYIKAISSRSTKTLLVEGVSDALVLQRIRADKLIDKRIDNASIFKSPEEEILGNKQKICLLKNSIAMYSEKFPQLRELLSTLVDREWDNVSTESFLNPPEWGAPNQCEKDFTTMGHSIENYFFNSKVFSDYLMYANPEVITPELIDKINYSFDNAMIFGLALSVAAKELACIQKLDDSLRFSHIDISGGKFILSASYTTDIAKRGVVCASDVVSKTNDFINEFSASRHLQREGALKWMLHGHLGEMALWTCLGKVLIEHGISSSVAEQFSYGNKNEKARFISEWITKEVAEESRFPLDMAITC